MFLKIIILFLKRVQIQLQSLLKPRQHWRLNICARNLRRGGWSTKTLSNKKKKVGLLKPWFQIFSQTQGNFTNAPILCLSIDIHSTESHEI